MENDLISNRYKPLFIRARGGFSSVEVAWDTKLTRRVAIKRMSTGISLPLASLEEARTVALLSSPNIVNVYDFEQTGSETLIIMENVDGPSLAELMADSDELLELDTATTILDGVVAALEYAHENQVLHLDIKPGNILIDESGHVKVSDFGLAELAGAQGFGEVQGGTIGYMPPEQLTGGLVDTRTDVWALAALSYQLLTGLNPFFALSPRESLLHISEEAYALPSELRPELSGGIDEALVKALKPQADTRPARVTDFWLALRPYLGKVGPGRRRLKTLVRTWAGKEAALLEGTTEYALGLLDDDSTHEVHALAEQGIPQTNHADTDAALDDENISIWNGNYQLDEDTWDEAAHAARQQRKARRREKRRKNRAERKKRPPLWQRLSPGGQVFIARSFSALAAASMVWLAMSALPYLSNPLAQAATAAAVSTNNPVPALPDAAFIARLALMIVVGLVAFIVPSIGAGLAALCLTLGFFFTGNWFVGNLVLVCSVVWWVFVGRRSPADATIFTLTPFLTMVGLPLLLPLLAGYFQNWRRALGTTAFGCFIFSLLSLLTYRSTGVFFPFVLGGETTLYGQFSSLPLHNLFGSSATLMQMPDMNQLFIPLANLFTSGEFWLIFISWMGTSVVMSLLLSGKSRVKYVIATLCATGVLLAGYTLPYVLFTGADNPMLLAAMLTRIAMALAVCLLLIALGVEPKPKVGRNRGSVR